MQKSGKYVSKKLRRHRPKTIISAGNQWYIRQKGVKGMIEIIYKENKEQANGNEGCFHLPKNIRQVGDANGRERIYLEDYVGTFLKKYFSAPEGRAAILFGEFKWADGISYFFIRSAAAVHTMEPAPDHLVFDDRVWTEVHDVMEKYFKHQQILGWALSLPGYGEDLNEQIIKAHLDHFGGNDKTLFRVNGQEREETFYTYEGGTLRSTGGFYIYYEKNEPMQSYLIEQNQNRSIENGESVPDRAVSDFRKIIEEKSEEEPERDHRKPILYAMTACAAAALLVTVTQKYGDLLPLSGQTGEPTVSVAGTAKGEKTQESGNVSSADRESGAEIPAETAGTGENSSGAEDAGTKEADAENRAASENPAGEEEQNPSGGNSSGSGEQNLSDGTLTGKEQNASGGEQTGTTEQNGGTAQADPTSVPESGASSGSEAQVSDKETTETAAQVWQEYTVQKGDSLSKISERYYGTMSRVKDICELNQIAVEDLIYAGQKIYLPK